MSERKLSELSAEIPTELCTQPCTQLWQTLNLPWVGVGLSFALLLGVLLPATQADPDLFARIAVGRMVAELGPLHFPLKDPFSFTADISPWIDHEWLSGWIFYRLAELGGDTALILAKLAFLLSFLAFVFLAQRNVFQDGAGLGRGLFGVLAMLLSYAVWLSTIRAQIFTYLMLAYLFFVLSSQKRSLLYTLPLLFAVWANAHGGVALGVAFFGLYALTRSRAVRRSYWLACAASCLATAITPWGFGYWKYLISALSMSRPGISEWESVPLSSPVAVCILFPLGFYVAGLYQLRDQSKRFVFPTLALLAASWMALQHLRLGPVYFLVLAIFCSEPVAVALERCFRFLGKYQTAVKQVLSWQLLGAAILSTVLGVRGAFPLTLAFQAYPVAAMDWLENSGLRGRLLLGFNEGSYALWRLFPKLLVSLDGRYEEVYSQTTVDRVRCALHRACAEQAQALNFIKPDVILLHRGDEAVALNAGYHPRYEDSKWMVLAKEDVPMVANTSSAADGAAGARSIWQARFSGVDIVRARR